MSQEKKQFDHGKLDGLSESFGIVRALKWAKFIMSYKSKEAVLREIERFIKDEEKLFPELEEIDRY